MNLLRHNVIKTFDWEPPEMAINPAYIKTVSPTPTGKTAVLIEGFQASTILDVAFEDFMATLGTVVLTVDTQHGAAPVG